MLSSPGQSGLLGIAQLGREELIGMRERPGSERHERALSGDKIGVGLSGRRLANEHRADAASQRSDCAMP